MMELVHQGIAVVMISSELPELLSMSDRVIVLSGGRIRGELTVNETVGPNDVMALATHFGSGDSPG